MPTGDQRKSRPSRKETITCQALAQRIAPEWAASVVVQYETDRKTAGEPSWPLREWVLLQLAALIDGCRCSMAQDATHFTLVHCLMAIYGRSLVERGVFGSVEEFETLSGERMSDYFGALHEEGGKMKRMARKFVINAGLPADDLAAAYFAYAAIVNASGQSRKMFDELQQRCRIVSEDA